MPGVSITGRGSARARVQLRTPWFGERGSAVSVERSGSVASSHHSRVKAKAQGKGRKELADGQGARKRKRSHTRASGAHKRAFEGGMKT